jgi:hypothetical protein
VVVPRLPIDGTTPTIARLNPVIEVADVQHILAPHLIAPVPLRELGEPVGDAPIYQDEIATALNVLLKGFP